MKGRTYRYKDHKVEVRVEQCKVGMKERWNGKKEVGRLVDVLSWTFYLI